MLLLERKIDQELELSIDDETLKIKVCRVRGKRVLLGFEGNRRIKIQRSKNSEIDQSLEHV
jgi:sRNA-binding carbon storage regulator CsrA